MLWEEEASRLRIIKTEQYETKTEGKERKKFSTTKCGEIPTSQEETNSEWKFSMRF